MYKKLREKMRLKFDVDKERAYRHYMEKRDKYHIRVVFGIFVCLYAFFSVTDYYLLPEYLFYLVIVRFGVVIPIFLLTIAWTFHPSFSKWQQLIVGINFAIGGLGIVFMLVLKPDNMTYYGGLFLVLTSGYFIINLDAFYATAAGGVILLGYVVGNLFVNPLSFNIVSGFLFYLAENIIGAVGAFFIERYKRNEFTTYIKLSHNTEKLNAIVHEKVEEISASQISTIFALAKLAESRDKETGEHIERVGSYCKMLIQGLPDHQYKEAIDRMSFTQAIELASALHDIGKVGIEDSILNKPGPLNDEEYAIMTNHTLIGSMTLSKLKEQYPGNLFVNIGIEITRWHHERWDGKGYPDGLKGEEIPLSARVMAIADVYDALTSKRPYKPAFSHEKAVSIIAKDSNGQFDPQLVDVFLKIESSFKSLIL